MPEPGHLAATVGIAAARTWGPRAAPFAVLAPARHSVVVRYLGLRMPLGVIALSALPSAVAVAVTAGLRLRRRDALLSILAGTEVQVVLATPVTGS